jgi:hypothetical protein
MKLLYADLDGCEIAPMEDFCVENGFKYTMNTLDVADATIYHDTVTTFEFEKDEDAQKFKEKFGYKE